MASKNAKTLDQAIDKILENYTSTLKEAVEYASKKAVKDIYSYSMSCLEEYYANYQPNTYDRTDYLWHAISPYAEKIKQTKDEIISTVGIQYDPAALDGIYYGSKTYSPADGGWILENYLMGIHPATNGSNNPETVVYYEITDNKSPHAKMQEYLEKTIPEVYKSRLLSYFIKNLK